MSFKDEQELQAVISKNTIILRTKQWVENFFCNLPYVQQGIGVAALHGCLRGIPAILVGAGPSLDKNIHLLKDLRSKAAIIVCDAALGAVLNADCQPHLVLVADSKQRVIKYITPVGHDTSNLLMIADTRIHPEVRDAWKGQIVWYQGPQIEASPFCCVAHQWSGQIGVLGSGGCVTSTMWCMAQAMLINIPIIFIGQDCSFTNIAHHHANSVKNTELYDTSNLIEEEDTDGNRVWTNGPLKSFRTWFEQMFLMNLGIHVNCTEGGTMTKGCLVMTLEQAASIFLKETRDVDTLLAAALAKAPEFMATSRWSGVVDYEGNAVTEEQARASAKAIAEAIAGVACG